MYIRICPNLITLDFDFCPNLIEAKRQLRPSPSSSTSTQRFDHHPHLRLRLRLRPSPSSSTDSTITLVFDFDQRSTSTLVCDFDPRLRLRPSSATSTLVCDFDLETSTSTFREKAAERGGYGGERCYARLHPRAVNCRKNLGPEEDQVNTSAISASRGGSGASNSKQSKYNLLFQ
ncbi:uncharacterized protein LOC114302268 isoform X4 [Camellia sinensis]|uniref:uncharacterized protein LOC114302268 isoform X4 n=1 Tax=Camellia sinensis TaxID=4442 RepID=UPI0010357EA5|nr:uncharacterized protein LOC114302268 isoform X4 [Camellia sinensis]